jgi:hypothetical protein
MKEIIRHLGEYINSHDDKLMENLYYILALLYYGK